MAVLRSPPFFGLLRLLMAKVPELTPAPTYLGRLQLQAKRGGSMQLRLRQCCRAGAAGAFTFIAVLEPEQIFLQV